MRVNSKGRGAFSDDTEVTSVGITDFHHHTIVLDHWSYSVIKEKNIQTLAKEIGRKSSGRKISLILF